MRDICFLTSYQMIKKNICIFCDNRFWIHLTHSTIIKLEPAFVQKVFTISRIMASSHTPVMVHNSIKFVYYWLFLFVC